jgi:hypothetical protein
MSAPRSCPWPGSRRRAGWRAPTCRRSWTAARRPSGDNQGNERTLNDLEKDPGELRNVLQRYPDVNRRLYSTILDAAGGPLPYYV